MLHILRTPRCSLHQPHSWQSDDIRIKDMLYKWRSCMFWLSNYLVKSCFWVYQPFGPSLVNICSFISQNSLLSPCPKCTIAETEMDGFCTYCFFFWCVYDPDHIYTSKPNSVSMWSHALAHDHPYTLTISTFPREVLVPATSTLQHHAQARLDPNKTGNTMGTWTKSWASGLV